MSPYSGSLVHLDLPPFPTRRSSDLHRPAEAPVATASDQSPPADPPPSDGQENSSTVFTYVIQPNDTLRELCLSLVDRKSTRLNSSHVSISYAVFCLKKKRVAFLSIR